jgi:hypothetical protein
MKKLLTILAISLMIFLVGGFFFAEEAQAQWSLGLLVESDDLLGDDFVESFFPELDIQFKADDLKFQMIYYMLTGLGIETEYSASYGDYMSIKHSLDAALDMEDPFSWTLKYTFEPALGGFTVITDMWTMEATAEFGFMTEQSNFDMFWDNAKWKNNFSLPLSDPMSAGFMIGVKYSPSGLWSPVVDDTIGDAAMDLIVEIDFAYAVMDALNIALDIDPTFHLFNGYEELDTGTGEYNYVSVWNGSLDIAFELSASGDVMEMMSYELELKPGITGLLTDGMEFTFKVDLSLRLDLDALLGTEEEEEGE